MLAAIGCAALMAGAIVFHVSRGEAANTPFNFLLGLLSLVVAWGRGGGLATHDPPAPKESKRRRRPPT